MTAPITSLLNSGPLQGRSVWEVAGAAILISAALNLVLGLIANLGGVLLETNDGDPVPVVAFAISTIIAGIVGIVLAWVARKLSINSTTFMIALAALAALTVLSPVFLADSFGTTIVLAIAHILPAIIVIPALGQIVAADTVVA